MRYSKVVLSASRKTIKCRQVWPSKVAKSELDELCKTLLKDGYTFVQSLEDCNVYRVWYEGEEGIGIGPAEGEAVITDLRGLDAFHIDDHNVDYKELSYKPSRPRKIKAR
jgi:hypothetical protein